MLLVSNDAAVLTESDVSKLAMFMKPPPTVLPTVCVRPPPNRDELELVDVSVSVLSALSRKVTLNADGPKPPSRLTIL
ncbi:hypothetical protein D3C75_695240 [compost metagenome]